MDLVNAAGQLAGPIREAIRHATQFARELYNPGEGGRAFRIFKSDGTTVLFSAEDAGVYCGGGLTGEIKLWPGSSVPTGFLLCDGTSYLRADYAGLFAVLGTTYGAADGTHFNVPDLRDKVPGGKGATFAALGTAYGSNANLDLSHTHSVPDHAHTLSAHTHSTDINHNHPQETFGTTAALGATSNIGAGASTASNTAHTHNLDVDLSALGSTPVTSGGPSSDATDSEAGVTSGAMSANSTKSPIQATLALNFIIKT